jgi:hypothetical protein
MFVLYQVISEEMSLALFKPLSGYVTSAALMENAMEQKD